MMTDKHANLSGNTGTSAKKHLADAAQKAEPANQRPKRKSRLPDPIVDERTGTVWL